jgi:hypothetical protein
VLPVFVPEPSLDRSRVVPVVGELGRIVREKGCGRSDVLDAGWSVTTPVPRMAAAPYYGSSYGSPAYSYGSGYAPYYGSAYGYDAGETEISQSASGLSSPCRTILTRCATPRSITSSS